MRYPVDAIVVCSGGRPVLFGAYNAIVNPGDKVIFSVPSWQNDSYSWITRRRIDRDRGNARDWISADDGPDQAASFAGSHALHLFAGKSHRHSHGTRSPRARYSTRWSPRTGRDEENRRRPLFILHDQMYGTLVSEGQEHVYPAALVPECARWLISADGVSKSYAGTGLRLGWMLVPPAVGARIRDLLSHAGAWAPRAEQAAVAAFLNDAEAIAEFRKEMDARISGSGSRRCTPDSRS